MKALLKVMIVLAVEPGYVWLIK